MGLRFEELTDEQWRFIEPVLPSQPETGRPRADDRKTINGILYVLLTGCKWSDMPEKYGSYVTAWRRLKRWQEEDIWKQIVKKLQEKAYKEGEMELDKDIIDSTCG
ncbi:MAG: Transposase [Candidatus Methanohalarchaeum thermophilum]|uniref:Transposase n=1 Tax=Methanohalarchaeum thermophilum TaxID=1903181 RepID=A0A1Q6DTQ2_METT1|nr:MAG: Transposase [Candidatus Methanohalarchaeum thermophilum]